MKLFCKKVLTNECECGIIFKHDLYAPVAQSVEHLTFNQGVRDSSSRRSTNKKDHPCDGLFYCLCITFCESKGIRNIAKRFAV